MRRGIVVKGVTMHSTNYSLVVNQSAVSVQSGGVIQLRAGDDNRFNTAGGAVEIAAGDGVHQNRGRGGTVKIAGGNGLGVQNFDNSVTGGAVQLSGGMSEVGTGGDIDLAGGEGATTGGSINIVSGTSTVSSSGSIAIRTSAVTTKGVSGRVILRRVRRSRHQVPWSFARGLRPRRKQDQLCCPAVRPTVAKEATFLCVAVRPAEMQSVDQCVWRRVFLARKLQVKWLSSLAVLG